MTIKVPNSPILLVGVVVGVLIGAADWVSGGGPGTTLLTGGLPIAYALVVIYLGRRSETASVLAGRPVDERWMAINLEASAWSLGATAVVVLGLFTWMIATGGAWQAFAFIGTVTAVTYVGSLLVLERRR